MKLNTIYQHVILLHCAAFIICENYYTIIAPGVIKSNRKYTVAVIWHSPSKSCNIRVSILGRSFNASDEASLQPLETKKFDFFPPKLDDTDYQLFAEGLSGCEFRNVSKLFSDSHAGPKIYIQLDKAVYKPLDLVQFRVVILDEHTRPVNINEPIRVEIFDHDQNRVKQFKDINLTKGVFTEKFKLSQQPVMGEWQIKASISGKFSHQVSKKFFVRLYTLPKFSVYMNAPKNFVVHDAKIQMEIYGKYTFDRYVEGTLHVELRTYFSHKVVAQKTSHIDGLTILDLYVENVEKLYNVYSLYLFAVLEESQTGIQRNTTSDIIIVRTEHYSIFMPYEEFEFRNNKPFRLKAYIEDWIKGPVRDTRTPVILEHGSRSYKTFLSDEGTASFEFEYEDGATYTVIFKDSKNMLPSFQLQKANDEVFYCKLKLKKSPRLGRPVEVQVISSFDIPYLVYTVVGHASLIQMGRINLPANKKTYTLNIVPSIEMIPTSFVFVHYILDGNFRYEEIELKFPMELENPISVEAPKQVKPGEEVTLKVKADVRSYVSILAVDLSVFLLDNRYDIYKENILLDLNEDRSYVSDANIARPGIISGLITLTNANYPISFKHFDITKGERSRGLEFRNKFPETWIFENYFINNTDTEIVLNIPETVTTWRITAFSNSDVKGFGSVDGPTDITTFLPFFISLNLPSEVKRDETVAIPVTIFNYHNQSLETEVTMLNAKREFQFMEPWSQSGNGDQQTKITKTPSNGGVTVKFLIKPLKTGKIRLYVSANSSLYADGVAQILKVVPEGITKHANAARYLSAVDNKASLQLHIPPNRVHESETISLMVGGNFLIPTLENFKEMINLPTGCGEQNMVNFAPNILILDYLKATGQLSKEKKLIKEIKFYIDIGYQQELSYRHKNGGYSVFGERHSKEVSTWLTAYVTRFFIKASRYAPIELRIIDSDLEYLAKQQQLDGSFPYTGYLFFKELQNKYGFTAFVLLTFMEDRRYARKYQTTIRKGLEYISSHLDDIDDVYAHALVLTALSKAKHSEAKKVIEKIQSLRKEDENGLMWWSDNDMDVEITAYVLLALLDAPGNHLPILKWLIEQRNSRGGFKSTHDTVVGLEALVKYAQKYNNATNWNMKISYSARDLNGNEVENNAFSIDENNALILQQHELPKAVRSVNFEVTGSGYSLVQLSSQYNVKQDFEHKYFDMKVNPTVYTSEELDLEVCFTYYALKEINNNTNMVIMEANLPSGFQTESEFSRDLLENDFIQRIESKNDETTMILYFDKLSTEVKHCVNIEAFRANEVENRKPAAINLYDYYNRNRFNSLFYTI